MTGSSTFFFDTSKVLFDTVDTFKVLFDTFDTFKVLLKRIRTRSNQWRMNQQVTQVSRTDRSENGANCRRSFANGTTNYVSLATDGRGTDLYQRKKSNVAAGRGREKREKKERKREKSEKERKKESERWLTKRHAETSCGTQMH